MPLYVLQVRCEQCAGVHQTGNLLKLDDGPPPRKLDDGSVAPVTIAEFVGDGPVPLELRVREKVRCPVTGKTFVAEDDEILVAPAPYRL